MLIWTSASARERCPVSVWCMRNLILKVLEGRKEMFYLMTHSTHFIYSYMASDMVKDHSDSERGNLLLPHGLLFPISSKGSFICIIPQTGWHIPLAFVTPVADHWLEREIAQWVRHEGSIRRSNRTMSECSYHGATSRSFKRETSSLCLVCERVNFERFDFLC